MALRLRRGTNAERLTITPLEGELIYVTDYATEGVSPLWVGNGTTLGGIPVDTDTDTQLNLSNFKLDNLANVDIGSDSTVVADGQVLAYDALSGDWRPTDQVASNPVEVLDDLDDVTTTIDGDGSTRPENGMALLWSVAEQRFEPGFSGENIEDLANVNGTPVDNQILVYNALANEWTPDNLSLDSLDGITSTVGDDGSTLPENGQALVWNVGEQRFEPGIPTLELNNLDDVTITYNNDGVTRPLAGATLIWNVGEQRFEPGIPTLELNNLDDVEANNPQVGDILFYNGFGWSIKGLEGQDYKINIVGNDSSIMVDTLTNEFNGVLRGSIFGAVRSQDGGVVLNPGLFPGDGKLTANTEGIHTGTVFGDVVGNLTGNVLGDDSSVIIDNAGKQITAENVSSTFLTITDTGSLSRVDVANSNTVSRMFLTREETGGLANDEDIGRIIYAERDGESDTTAFTLGASKSQWSVLPSISGTPDYGQFFKIWNNGKVMINGDTGISGFDDLAREPDSQLDIYGVMKLTPQTAPPSSPVEGMIAVADRVTWDPASVGSGPSYPVYYNGTGWDKMT